MRQDLIDGWAVQETLREGYRRRAGTVRIDELQNRLAAVVDPALLTVERAITVGVEVAPDASIEGVVEVRDDLVVGALEERAVLNLGQPVVRANCVYSVRLPNS